MFRKLFFIIFSIFFFIGCTHSPQSQQQSQQQTSQQGNQQSSKQQTRTGPTFRTADLFENHFQKHVREQEEFGNITKEEYLAKAQTLVSQKAGGQILVKKNAAGDTLFYDKGTNEFAVMAKDGYIRTFFKPQDGIAYFNKQSGNLGN